MAGKEDLPASPLVTTMKLFFAPPERPKLGSTVSGLSIDRRPQMARRANIEAVIVYVGLAVTVIGMFWWMDRYW
jgi:hypothetical protein